MPRKEKYTKNEILDIAFQLLRTEGQSNLTVRSIASKLQTTVIPIYSKFENMDTLNKALAWKSADLLIEYQQRDYYEGSINYWVNSGMGYLIFAREEKNLFRQMFFNNFDFLSKEILDYILARNIEMMKQRLPFKHFEQDEDKIFLQKHWFYVHGIASLIVVDAINDVSNDELLRLLYLNENHLGCTHCHHEKCNHLKKGKDEQNE
ncbi:MAG: TetR/AcrR family transcriptional regulator [Marinisporobacter sp.]|jgi:AcrR family transcriptional regulator|nr:TetR/AcrR family transcriptional regulator [Marinisporobacter sp.]